MSSIRALAIRNALAATLVPLLLLTLYLLGDRERAARAAVDRALGIAVFSMRQLLAEVPDAALQREIAGLQGSLEIRLTVIAADGRVVAESDGAPERLGSHADRPEVIAALRGEAGAAERFSESLGQEMRYLAVAGAAGPRRRVYRAAMPLTRLRQELERTRFALMAAFAAVVVLAIFFSAALGRQIAAPVEALSDAAARFSAGDASARVLPDGPEALRRLGATFNTMVDRLNSHVRRLDQAQGYLDAILAQMPDGLLVLDSGGVVVRVNAAAERLLGLPASRIRGRPVLAVLMSYALDREVRRVLEGGDPGERDPAPSAAGERGAEVEARTADGRALRLAVGPLVIGEARAGAVVLLQDTTELRRVDEMRRDFVANVSHELRTPAAAIRAMAETLLLRAGRRPELLGEYAPRIVEECGRIDRLVGDLLLLAETESGRLRLQPETLELGGLAREVARQVEPVTGGERLEVAAAGPVRVRADRFALGQCLRNLVDNALRHAPGGRVRIGFAREGELGVLSVADEGPGIPPEDLPRLFERFYRVGKSRDRERGGSGLGLSIVRHLAEAQGGRAWVESRPGQGSTFYVGVPLAPADRPGEPA